MNIWLVMVLGGLLTFGMRLSFIYLFGRIEIPEMVHRALRFVPPSVLSAIILPQLLMPSGSLDISLDNHRLLAGFTAILIAWLTKNTLLTILVGMVVLIILQIIL
jgi:branched-subunit amino acid transport protein